MKHVIVTIAMMHLAAHVALAQSFPSPIPISSTQVGIREVARLPNPDATNVPRMSVATRDPSGRLFVNDQRGPLYTVDPTGGSVVEYLDIRDFAGIDLTNQTGEQGFQGFAFHPDFSTPNAPGFGRLYTMHSSSNITPAPDFSPTPTDPPTTSHEVLIEWQTNNPNAPTFTPANPAAPYRELIRFDDRFRNHNGGLVAFNPLGGSDRNNLYVMMGDGGSANDPFDAGQATNTPYGKLLRIDPLGANSANGKYGIVAANAFASDGNPNTLGEVYSYGLRNPQRFGWDTDDGTLYISDIGQDAKEEINVGVNGGNFGWDLREGSVFPPGAFINPVAEWEHAVVLAPHPSPLPPGLALNSDAVTMGEVFRGAGIPQLDGMLMAGDNPKGVFYILDVDSDPLDGGGEGWSELIATDESSGQQKRLITMINEERALLGLPEANRADLRFSVNTPGEVFILNKQDGVLRMLTFIIPEPSSLLLGSFALITFSVVLRQPRRLVEESAPERKE
jgi:hypothetical protein